MCIRDRALLEPAEIYLRIVGGACFLNALIPIFSSYLRVFGYTKHSLIGTVAVSYTHLMNNVKAGAEEIVMREIIYV